MNTYRLKELEGKKRKYWNSIYNFKGKWLTKPILRNETIDKILQSLETVESPFIRDRLRVMPLCKEKNDLKLGAAYGKTAAALRSSRHF